MSNMFVGESRNHAIVRLWVEGKSYREIKEILHVGFSSISQVITYWNENRQILPEATIGRPTKISSPELQAFVHSETQSNRRSPCYKLSKTWNQEKKYDSFTVSPSTIWRVRKEMHYNFKPPKIRQYLTDEQIHKRNIFAHSILQSDINLDSIVFSDESRICLGPDSRFIWYQPGEVSDDVYQEYTKAEIGVMIWAAIGYNFKSNLIICHKNVDAKEYRQIIKDSNMVETLNQIHGQGEWLFMQDGAKPHTSKDTIKFLLKRMSLLSNWPANSPDMNPIEHLWAILKYRIREMQPKSIPELEAVLMEEWAKIDMNLINVLVRSFKKRILLVANQQGRQIGTLLNSYDVEDIPFNKISEEEKISIISKYSPQIEECFNENAKDFSIEEDKLLLYLFGEIGSKWKLMSEYFENRKPIDLRNRFIRIRGADSLKRKK